MKTFGKMSIAFLYDDETDTIAIEPILESSKPDVPIDVLQRVYIALGMRLHFMLSEKRYSDLDSDEIEKIHAELLGILEYQK